MERDQKMVVRKIFLMSESLEQAIQDYRFTKRIPTESEAIRKLIAMGLSSVPRHAEQR